MFLRGGPQILMLLILVCALAGTTHRVAAADRLNVVLILADDLGYECIGANGGTSYKTPHLDQLAATGARFEHCYAQPLCTPTRVQMMTGQSNVRNYVRFGLLDAQQRTFGHILKEAGFATGIVGKWQLDNGLNGPHHFGFDDYCLWQLNRRPPRYANPGLEINGRQIDFSNGEYGPDLVQQHALRFIEQHRDQPFFLYYPMMLTHAPFQPTPDSSDWDPNAIGETINQDGRHFGEMLTYLDKLVGQLVSRLEDLQIRERTLILFVGDNGTALKVSSEWNGQTIIGGKSKTTDAGTRVPLIANCSGLVAPRVISDLVDTTDFLPTICDAVGIGLPTDRPFDGRSFLPQLKGETGTPRSWLYCWYAPNQGNRIDEPVEFARNHHYKLYGDGRLSKLDGRYGEDVLAPESFDAAAQMAKEQLSQALAQFADARPKELRRPARSK
ncbi:sulfatase-like hydrolase/transferase [Schlesneria paludicola]|uniref:sulfatase-like hydrolase/transferase n=1 Tax=Schlesneria paludicola TaxID=360056 RepID=UPI000303F31D|nr:sulfatase-like hydrolase/transferase [Schlesneria paludicola]